MQADSNRGRERKEQRDEEDRPEQRVAFGEPDERARELIAGTQNRQLDDRADDEHGGHNDEVGEDARRNHSGGVGERRT